MSQSAPVVLHDSAAMTAWADRSRARGERIAFVPTMGALHAGHLKLLEEARAHGDRVVLSIFVNPTQFGPTEDLARYPRDLEGDLARARTVGIDACFAPAPPAMYPPGHQTVVEVRGVSQGLCGDRRPGHFAGVATVVAKLFNIVRPHVALFGEKDYQQLAVIRQMTRDLDFGIEIVGVPTVREPDGLAMSSRNAYLSAADRARAVSLSRALFDARAAVSGGETEVAALVKAASEMVGASVDRIDYLEVRDAETLLPIERVDRPAVMLVAAFVGGTRLIDNVRL